jgi:hypothetical protein
MSLKDGKAKLTKSLGRKKAANAKSSAVQTSKAVERDVPTTRLGEDLTRRKITREGNARRTFSPALDAARRAETDPSSAS